jgi:hypothetical protein
MNAQIKKIIEDTRCIDALDDLLCSIQKVSQPELQYNKPNHPTHRVQDEKKYVQSLNFISHMTVPRMLVDLFTFGAFTQYLYK